MRGKPLVYLDNSATSLKPSSVLDAIARYYSTVGASIHRGVYQLSEEASAQYDLVRQKTAEFIGCDDNGEIIFTSSATHSSNMLALGWGERRLAPGDEITISEMEHHALFVPWLRIAQKKRCKLNIIPINPEDQRLITNDLDSYITPKTKVVAVSGMSNVTGWMPDLPPIIERAKQVGAITIIDAAQLVCHNPINVSALGCDALFFSSHKMLGATGLGILYGTKALLNDLEPLFYGGDMIESVDIDSVTFKSVPERLESGTPNIAGIIGFGAAIDYLQSIGFSAIRRHEARLLAYALERAAAMKEMIAYGPSQDIARRGAILPFNIRGIHAHDIGAVLDAEGIAIRTGHHCAQPFMRKMGIAGTARASFYFYNTCEEIDRLYAALERALSIFARRSR